LRQKIINFAETKQMRMKKAIVMMLAVVAAIGVKAQTIVPLGTPQWDKSKEGSATLVETLQSRHSERSFASDEITDAELSKILWAACGINRPEQKRITAPSAINAQDVVVYVCRKDGAYRYNALQQQLEKVSDKDLRTAVAGRQEFAAKAPVSLVLVSDQSKFGNRTGEGTQLMGAIDCGYVSQNICLMCEAMKLKTVPRATMDKTLLATELHLGDNQLILLNHPIGR
jgi:SagB-type dehydrogenase family enzyme